MSSWIDPYIESVLAALGAMDFGTLQPFDHLQFQPLMAKEFVEKVDELVQRAKARNVPFKELVALWPGMSSLRCQLYFLLLDLKCARLPREKRLELADFFFNMLSAGAKDDVFGFRSNIVHTNEEVKQLLSTKKLQRATPEIARWLGKIYMALYNLGAGYYVDFYLDYGAENEGPYDVSGLFEPGHVLIIKRLMGMKPVELFPTAADFIADDIRTYAVYQNVAYRTNLVSVHAVYDGDTINGLKWWGLELDGRLVEAAELQGIFAQAAEASVAQWKRLTGLPFEEQKAKAAEIRCFGMRKLFMRAGMDWRPTAKMLDALKGKPFADAAYWGVPQDKEQSALFWRKLYDPREEAYPEREF